MKRLGNLHFLQRGWSCHGKLLGSHLLSPTKNQNGSFSLLSTERLISHILLIFILFSFQSKALFFKINQEKKTPTYLRKKKQKPYEHNQYLLQKQQYNKYQSLFQFIVWLEFIYYVFLSYAQFFYKKKPFSNNISWTENTELKIETNNSKTLKHGGKFSS